MLQSQEGSMGPQPADEPISRISVFLAQRQLDALRGINQRTGIPVSVLIRQGVDLVLAQHARSGPAAGRRGTKR
jgi:hypothetical protein